MVIDPKAFFEEVDQMRTQGISITPERLKVSSRAHLIMPYHRALDHTSEERLGNEKIGTTLRGIGPAYEDKAGRRGIRVSDALSPEVLKMRIERNLEEANRIIVLYGQPPLYADEIFTTKFRRWSKDCARLSRKLRIFWRKPKSKIKKFCSKEHRRRFSTLTTELIRMSLLQIRRRVARRSAREFRRIISPAFWELSALTRRASAKVRFRPKCSTRKKIWQI